MVSRKKAAIILFSIAVILVGAALFAFWFRNREVTIRLDAANYGKGEEMLITIKNNFWSSEICFSSCYPYFIQRKNGDWGEYKYKNCIFEDRIVKCLNPGETKTFRTSVPNLAPGIYRISLPFCRNCSLGTVFQEEERCNSDLFEIK